uniref:Uncharacterized protein n=1 Tax=Rhizophora mucronata TaxID=61149 RepID=A0A2P2Q691_RHIMU
MGLHLMYTACILLTFCPIHIYLWCPLNKPMEMVQLVL